MYPSSLFIFLLLKLNLFLQTIDCQSTEECGVKYACFLYPTGCTGKDCSFVYKWVSLPDNKTHHFRLEAKLASPTEPSWLGIGFSTDPMMGNDNVVICKNSPRDTSVLHYFTTGRFAPGLLDQKNPVAGLSGSKVTLNNDYLRCSFNREKYVPSVDNYYDLKNKFHILAATGPLSNDGELFQHVFKIPSESLIDFNTEFSVIKAQVPPNQVLVKTHACFMIAAWMILGTTGGLVARYYKFILAEYKIFNLKVWFFVHRPLMMSSLLLSVVGILVILADKKFEWIEKQRHPEFAHSIFGVLTITFSIIQILVATFRPHQEHYYRPVFNQFHKLFGGAIITFSIITLFIGAGLARMNLSMSGIGVMIGWSIWLAVFLVVAESFERRSLQSASSMALSDINQSNGGIKSESLDVFSSSNVNVEKLKLFLMIIHVLVAFGLSITLFVIISKAKIV